jgi:DNA-binding Xre family transcriptional regulator
LRKPTRQKPGRQPGKGQPPTRLQEWLDRNGFTSAQLEKEIAMSRQAMTKIRAGGDVRRKTMVRINRGCSHLARRPVAMDEIFDLDPESPANQT